MSGSVEDRCIHAFDSFFICCSIMCQVDSSKFPCTPVRGWDWFGSIILDVLIIVVLSQRPWVRGSHQQWHVSMCVCVCGDIYAVCPLGEGQTADSPYQVQHMEWIPDASVLLSFSGVNRHPYLHKCTMLQTFFVVLRWNLSGKVSVKNIQVHKIQRRK